ncbi:MAG: hypothetical protein AAF467_08035 [Actinomycetota bacterium]
MHPISTALFLVGYGLGLPILFRMTTVVAVQNRLAFIGHQVGFGIALGAWLLSGRVAIAVIHGLWIGIAAAWFSLSGKLRSASD